jgi:hypothetical protein
LLHTLACIVYPSLIWLSRLIWIGEYEVWGWPTCWRERDRQKGDW